MMNSNENVSIQMPKKAGEEPVSIEMQLFNMQGRFFCTMTIRAPKEMTETDADWIADKIKSMFNSEGKARW